MFRILLSAVFFVTLECMKTALENIRVIDLSRVLAGPFCTQILGDLGADVIKIERPHIGDETRYWGPPFLKDIEGNDTSESAYYLSANRNKRSLTVDITTPEGQEIVHALLENADVMIQNFKAGGLEKYGLGYEQIKERHPHIIYCHVTGFGQTGPMSNDPGYDFLVQALGGLMASTGDNGAPPMKVGVALSDVITGLFGCIGILSALHARKETGKGQLVDTALLDCTVSSMVNLAQYFLTSNKTAPRLGNAHSTIVPYQAFETQDGHIILTIGNDRQFARFCEAIDKHEWTEDERFSTNSARVIHRDILVPQIEEIMRGKQTADWVALLKSCNVPGGPVNTMDQVFAMEQIEQRDMKIKMPHEKAAHDIDLVGSPLKLSETPVQYSHAPPHLGQHTDDILSDILSYSDDQITALKKDGII